MPTRDEQIFGSAAAGSMGSTLGFLSAINTQIFIEGIQAGLGLPGQSPSVPQSPDPVQADTSPPASTPPPVRADTPTSSTLPPTGPGSGAQPVPPLPRASQPDQPGRPLPPLIPPGILTDSSFPPSQRSVEREVNRDLRDLRRRIERARRGARRVIDKVARERSIWRKILPIIIGTGGPIIVGTGGILFPRELGRGDRPLGPITLPDRIKRRQPVLEPVEIPQFPRREMIPDPRRVEEIIPNVPPRRAPIEIGPVTVPQRQRLPQRATAPAPRTPAMQRAIVRALLGLAGARIGDLVSERSLVQNPLRTIQPSIPTTDPLTPTQDSRVPFPQPTRQGVKTQQEVCDELAKRQRKKRRKCDQRANVVWAGGPNKGKIAGTKCFQFRS